MRRGVALVALAAALAGCAGGVADGPPELELGVHECSHCRMIVSELGSAAVARGPRGEEARFDDLACLAAYARERGAGGGRIWIHLDGEPAWRDPSAVRFVHDPRRLTPMGSGWVAVPAAGAGGDALAWPDLLETTREESHEPS